DQRELAWTAHGCLAYQQLAGVRLPALSMVRTGHWSEVCARVAMPVIVNVGGGPSLATMANVNLPDRLAGAATLSADSDDAYALRSARYCCWRFAASAINACASART